MLLFSRIREVPRILRTSPVPWYDREQIRRGYWESLRWFRVNGGPAMSQSLLFPSAIPELQIYRLKRTTGLSDSPRFWKIDSTLIYAWESPRFGVFNEGNAAP